jgi:hypothetical protein
LLALFLSSLAVLAGDAERDRPIAFKPGQTAATSEGRFSDTAHEVYFSFYATKGEHLVVRIRPVTPGLITAGVVIYPSGKQDGGPGGIVFDSSLDETGKFRIKVTRRQTEVNGRFRILVKLSDGYGNKAK